MAKNPGGTEPSWQNIIYGQFIDHKIGRSHIIIFKSYNSRKKQRLSSYRKAPKDQQRII